MPIRLFPKKVAQNPSTLKLKPFYFVVHSRGYFVPEEVYRYNSNVVYTRKHMNIILMSLLPTIHLENLVAHSGNTLKLTIPTHCPRLLPV